MEELQEAAIKDGISDAIPGVRGSSVTGVRWRTGAPFDGGGKLSDIDAFITTNQSYKFRQNGFMHPNQVAKKFPNLTEWGTKWTQELGRKVEAGIWQSGRMPDHGQMFWP